WARLVGVVLLAGVLLIATGTRSRRRERLRWPLMVLACLAVASVSVGSHAASARAVPLIAVTVDALHLDAASMWLGGVLMLAIVLPPILGMLRAERTALLRVLVPRVSTTALVSVAVLVTTGLFSAWEQVATVDALVETPYGQSLLLKLALLVFLLATAAVN